jgi:hypothetical protein
MEKQNKDLEYFRKNAEEDYIKTPISVLRYIMELEAALREPTIKNSVCDGCGNRLDEMDIAMCVCYNCQKEIEKNGH